MSKTVNTKCRAKGGPAYCADPNCPERNHRAAREAQAKDSFMTSMLQSIGLKNTPSENVIRQRDRLDAANVRLETAVANIENPTARAAAEAQIARPLVSRNGYIDLEEIDRLANSRAELRQTFDLGNVSLPGHVFTQIIDIAQKHNVTMTRTGEPERSGRTSIKVDGLKLQGTNADLTAARQEIADLLKAEESRVDAKLARLDSDIAEIDLKQAKNRRFPRHDDTAVWDAIDNLGGRKPRRKK